MYPLPIYLIACPDRLGHDLACVALNLGTSVAGTFPNLRSATDQFRSISVDPAAPPVLILHAPDAAALGDLKLLRRSIPAAPIVAVVPSELLVNAMRAGATQVVTAPLHASDCESALAAIAEQFAAPVHHGRLVSVSGATGGVGATTLAINLAAELAELGRSVVLSEPTAQVGKLAVHLDASPTYTVNDLLRRGDDIDQSLIDKALVPLGDRLRVLAADPGSLPTATPPTSAILTLVDYLRHAADFAVVDLPCTYDDAFFGVLASADVVVLVGQQRIPSVRTLQMLLDFLSRVERPDREVRVVINRYDPGLAGFDADRLRQVLKLESVDTIADDPRAVTTAVNAGHTLRAGGRSAALDDIARFARSLDSKQKDVPANGEPALIGRLARAFGFGRGARV